MFAPTPLPADTSPLVYTHPSGAFSLSVPRLWSLHEQHTTQLASAAFTPPGADEPLLMVSAVHLNEAALALPFSELLDRYQTQHRPDRERYTETARDPMGDGSWRISGYRTLPGGRMQPANTFIEQAGPLLLITELTLPSDANTFDQLETAANSVRSDGAGTLEAADLSVLAFARPALLGVLHTTAWTAGDGVFFVTGEVANWSAEPWAAIPVDVLLETAEGAPLSGASDLVMGHALMPGAFAPFSLRFGGGQPELARGFTVRIGSGSPLAEGESLVGADALTWADSAVFDGALGLTVTGEVTNTGPDSVHSLRAVATVFDAAQNVVGAAWADLMPDTLAPGERAPYRFVFNELGGAAVNYIVTVQGMK